MTDNKHEDETVETTSATPESQPSQPAEPPVTQPAKPAKSGRGLALFALLIALVVGAGTGYLWYLWDQYKRAQTAESASLDARMERALDKVVQKRETTIEDIQTQLQNQKQETQNLANEVKSLQDTIGGLKNTAQSIQSDIASMHSDIRTFQGSLQTLKGGLETHKGNMEIQKSDTRTLQTDIRNLQNDIQALQGNVQTLKETAETQQGDSQTLKQQLQALQKDAQGLKDNLSSLSSKIQTLGQNVQDLSKTEENDILELKNDMRALRVEFKGVQGSMETLNSEMQSVKQLTETQRGDTLILKKQLQSLQEDALNFKDNLAALDEKLTKSIQARKEAIAEIDDRIKKLLLSQDDLRNTLESIRTLAAKGGDVNALPLSEVEYLLRIADYKLEFQRDIQGALQALQTAQKRLDSIDEKGFQKVKQMISKDIDTLRGIETPDRSALAHKILEMEQRLDQLPLRIDMQIAKLKAKVRPKTSENTPQEGTNQEWWQQISDTAWKQFKDIVIIRHEGISEPPLISMDEEYFLIENLRLVLESMRTALLAGDAASFQDTNQTAQKWIETYFNTDNPKVADFLSELEALQKIQINPYIPDIASTLQTFNEVMQRREPMRSMVVPANVSDAKGGQ